jgi:hypothetical protein
MTRSEPPPWTNLTQNSDSLRLGQIFFLYLDASSVHPALGAMAEYAKREIDVSPA